MTSALCLLFLCEQYLIVGWNRQESGGKSLFHRQNSQLWTFASAWTKEAGWNICKLLTHTCQFHDCESVTWLQCRHVKHACPLQSLTTSGVKAVWNDLQRRADTPMPIWVCGSRETAPDVPPMKPAADNPPLMALREDIHVKVQGQLHRIHARARLKAQCRVTVKFHHVTLI